MARPRLDLQRILEAIPGVAKVYFQPPDSTRLQYPCIVYTRDVEEVTYADNQRRIVNQRYMVTVMDRDPDSLIPKAVAELPMCSYYRFFTAADLNHDVFTLYF